MDKENDNDNDKAIATATATASPAGYWTDKRTAAFFGLHPKTLKRMAARGDFPKPLHFGRAVRYCAADVMAWVEKQKAAA